MTANHTQDCPIHQGRRCDCGYVEPVASAGNALSMQAMSDLVAQAQIAFNLDKYSSFEVALIRKTEAALASQSTPVAPVVEQACVINHWSSRTCQRGTNSCNVDHDAAALAQSTPPMPAGEPSDPLDWPLPCDVTVGHGTIGKGVKLRTLVLRMKTLYKMATGNDADEVANRTPAERRALFEASPLATPRPPEPAAPVAQEPLHASVITRIWKECRAQKMDYVCFAWRIEARVRASIAAQTAAPLAPEPVCENMCLTQCIAEVQGCASECPILPRRPFAAPTTAQGLSDAEIGDWPTVVGDEVTDKYLAYEGRILALSRHHPAALVRGLCRALLSTNRAAQETKP